MNEIKASELLPLVYSCSGCSSAAQMANDLAIRMDRAGQAEMSCIAGVGGDVPSLVKVAKSGRTIIALDGCPLACARSCLARHQVTPTAHFELSDYKIKKVKHQNFDPEQAQAVYQEIIHALKESRVIENVSDR